MAKSLNFILSIFTLSVLISSFSEGKKQPCQLVWKSINYLEPIPEDAVPTHGNDNFITRGLVSFRLWSALKIPGFGRITNSSDSIINKACLASTSNSRCDIIFFDILTNPNDCAIQWVDTVVGGEIPEGVRHLAVPIQGFPTNGYIGRIETAEKKQFGGYIQNEFSYYINEAGVIEKQPSMYAQALLSSINLRMELRNFIFDVEMDQGDADLLGLDVITNESPVEVKQRVVHRKSVTEKFTFSESEFYSSVTSWKVGFSIPSSLFGVGVEFGFEHNKENGEGSSGETTHENEKEVVSERVIIVPPFTSVEACSFTSFKDKADLPYTAEGKYTVKGHSGAAVMNILQNDEDFPHQNILRVEEDAVIVSVNAVITVSIPTKTTFTLSEINSPNGCRMVSNKIYNDKRNKAFKKKVEIPI